MYTGHGLFAPNSNIYPGSYNSPRSTGYNQRGKVYGSNTYQNKPDQTPGHSHPNSYQKQQSGHYQNVENMNYNTNTYGHTPNGYTLPVQNSKGNYGNIYSQSKPPLKRFGKPQKKKFYWPYFPYSASDYGNPLYKKGNEHKKDSYDKGEKYSDVPYEGHMYNSAKKVQSYSTYL